jgi:methionyl-tRNA synthetase
MGGAKMSKSAGNVARYEDYVRVFGVDALRYFVMREMPLGLDANFSDEGVLTRFNADLANDLGNLVSRATTMVHRYCDGVVPLAAHPDALDAELERQIDATVAAVARHFEECQIAVALQETWELIRAVNQYIVKREPWALAKRGDQRATLDATLYHAADALRVTAAMVDPVMPIAADRIRRMLGITQEPWMGLKAGGLQPGTRLGPTEPLFPRIEKTLEELRTMTPDDSAPPVEQKPAAPVEEPRIAIDEFLKVDLRVAKVLTAERVPNSRKLVKMTIDAGTEQRTLVAGIAEAYEPDALVGRTIVMVFNLKPAKLMGIESNGMVLAASPDGGKPTLLAFDGDVPPGTRVR